MEKQVLMTDNLLSNKETAEAVGVTTVTLANWYEWFEITENKPEGTPELPKYYRVGSPVNGPKFWRAEDIPKLIEFKNWIPRGRGGVMAKVSQKYWAPEFRKK